MAKKKPVAKSPKPKRTMERVTLTEQPLSDVPIVAEEPTITEGLPLYVTVRISNLNIRNKPSKLNSDVLHIAKQGDKLKVSAQKGDWYLVRTTKIPLVTGYVMVDLVEEVRKQDE